MEENKACFETEWDESLTMSHAEPGWLKAQTCALAAAGGWPSPRRQAVLFLTHDAIVVMLVPWCGICRVSVVNLWMCVCHMPVLYQNR